MSTGPVVLATGLARTYIRGATKVPGLRGVDVQVDEGEFLAITGQSGAGKSTLLHLLAGLDRPDAGEVWIQGTRLSDLSDVELSLLRRRRLGIVLQFFNLLPTLSALENVAFPLLLDGVPGASERAAQALDSVNLAHRADSTPAELSGGEQQRVALARTLVNDPAAIFADEPTGALDSLTAEDILRLLRQLANGGHTVVLVTHDPLAASFADRVIHLRDGVVVPSQREPDEQM